MLLLTIHYILFCLGTLFARKRAKKKNIQWTTMCCCFFIHPTRRRAHFLPCRRPPAGTRNARRVQVGVGEGAGVVVRIAGLARAVAHGVGEDGDEARERARGADRLAVGEVALRAVGRGRKGCGQRVGR